MANGITLHVEGLRELQKALRQTADESPKAIQSAHKAVAEIVAVQARRNASRNSSRLGSRVRTFGTTRKAGIRFLGHRPRGQSRTTDAFLQEFGGRAPLFGDKEHWHTVKPKRRSGYIVYPAIAATRDQVMARYLKELDRALKAHFDQ